MIAPVRNNSADETRERAVINAKPRTDDLNTYPKHGHLKALKMQTKKDGLKVPRGFSD